MQHFENEEKGNQSKNMRQNWGKILGKYQKTGGKFWERIKKLIVEREISGKKNQSTLTEREILE